VVRTTGSKEEERKLCWVLRRPYEMPNPLPKICFRKCIVSWDDDVLKFWQVWIISKEAYHESGGRSSIFWGRTPLRIAFTELGPWSTCQICFRQKCPLLPDRDRFHFVYAKYSSGYISEVWNFVTQEVATAKSIQTPPLHKNYKTYADLGSTTWKNSSKKSITVEMFLIKAF